MTDFFDPGDGDDQVLARLQDIIRELGLQAYFNIVADEAHAPSTSTIHLLHGVTRLLGELHDLDESLEDADEWMSIAFMADPDLPRQYREPTASPFLFMEHTRWPAWTVMDRQRSGERIQAIVHAQKLILKLRHAVRRQA